MAGSSSLPTRSLSSGESTAWGIIVLAVVVSSPDADMERLKCPVCLDFMEKPRVTPCGHAFCCDCLAPFKSLSDPSCPVCRAVFKPSKLTKDRNLEAQLKTVLITCTGCSKQMPVYKSKSHSLKCKSQLPDLPTPPITPTTRSDTPTNAKNRHTFSCPFCSTKHLDTEDLIKHCTSKHRTAKAQVVCPICASMPWGDPAMKSANFLDHLNHRHKFEYHTYVDYAQDDESMLQAALAASMVDQ